MYDVYQKQSAKGILIIYTNQLYKIIKSSWIILLLLLNKLTKLPTKALVAIGGLFLLLTIVSLLIAYLKYKNFQFKITKDQFYLKTGIFNKSQTILPFEKIQNVKLKQNFIQQFIKVYELTIETAGSTDTEISIKALSFKDADTLRKLLLTRKNTSETTKLEDKEEKENSFLQINLKQLFKVALTENHLQSLLILIAFSFGLYQQIMDFVEEFGYIEVMEENLPVDDFSFSITTILFLAVFMFIIVLSIAIIVSIIRTILFHFNLSAYLNEKTLRIQQGLLTKKTVLLHQDKIQYFIISTNPLKKKVGIASVTFKQAISGRIKKAESKLIKLVGCHQQHLIKVKETFLKPFQEDKLEIYKPNNYYKNQLYFRGGLVLVFINLFMLINGNLWLLLINILWLTLLVIMVYTKYRKSYFKLQNDLLIVGGGIINTNTTYATISKMQYVNLQQSFFQKRKNVASLVFQTASGEIKIPSIDISLAQEVYNYSLFKIESST